MKKLNYIGYNPNKLRYPSQIYSSHDLYRDITMKHINYRGGSDYFQDKLPDFDRSNLIAYYPFIADLKDYSSNANHFTLDTTKGTTGHKPLFLPAQRNKALYLQNTVYVANHIAAWLLGTGNFTIMFWHHVNHQEQWGLAGLGTNSSLTAGFISKRTNDSNAGWEFYNNGTSTQSGRMNFRILNTDLVSSTLVNTNKWTHYAVVRSGTSTNQTTMYVDGVVNKTGTFATNITSTEKLKIGVSIHYNKFNIGSSVQHFIAASRAWSINEIREFINKTKGVPTTYVSSPPWDD